jgi:hypothetical protein
VPALKRKIVVTAAVAVVAAGIAGGLLWRTRQARNLTEKDTIVLGDFANSTGDPVGHFGNAKEAWRVFEHRAKVQHNSRAGDYSIS